MNNNNKNTTKFILTCKSPLSHYLLSFFMLILSIMLIVFSYYLFQHKEKIIEKNMAIQTQYLNNLKFIKQHKICKIYNNKEFYNLTDKLNDKYKNYSLQFDFTNSHFVENYNNFYLRHIGQLYLKIPDNFDDNLNNLLSNIGENFFGVLQYDSCYFNENNNDLYCQIYLNFYSKQICL